MEWLNINHNHVYTSTIVSHHFQPTQLCAQLKLQMLPWIIQTLDSDEASVKLYMHYIPWIGCVSALLFRMMLGRPTLGRRGLRLASTGRCELRSFTWSILPQTVAKKGCHKWRRLGADWKQTTRTHESSEQNDREDGCSPIESANFFLLWMKSEECKQSLEFHFDLHSHVVRCTCGSR